MEKTARDYSREMLNSNQKWSEFAGKAFLIGIKQGWDVQLIRGLHL